MATIKIGQKSTIGQGFQLNDPNYSASNIYGNKNSTITPISGTQAPNQSVSSNVDNSVSNSALQAPAPTPTSSPAPAPYVAPAPAMASAPAPAPAGVDVYAEGERIKREAQSIQEILNGMNAGTGDAGAGNMNSGQYEEVEQLAPWDQAKAERDATRNQMKLYQAEIDATNQVYDQLLNEARIEGTGRLGSQRAGAARGGLLGSDFASSQKANVQSYNTDISRGIGAERTAAIGAIMGNVRQSVADEVKGKREARQAGAEEYMDFITRRGERRDNFKSQLVQDAITQGFDLTQLSEEELATYLDKSGISAGDLLASYQTAKKQQDAKEQQALIDTEGRELKTAKTRAEIAKIEADVASGKLITIGEGTTLYNTETGETWKNPKTYAPKSGSTPGVDKIYSTKDLPGAIRSDLVDDIQAGQTEEQLMALYPEVNLETIQEYQGQFAPLEEEGGAWWNFWDDK